MLRGAMPPAEVAVDGNLVRALLEEQHPDLARLPIVEASSGWDNALFRLGDSLAVRLPRRALAAPLILNEQRWLGELAPRLPLPVPVATRVGIPGCGYPWAWSITPWFQGVPFWKCAPLDELAAARTLGAFVEALHAPAPAQAPRNAFRGVPLGDRSERVHEHVRILDGLIDRDRVLAGWEKCTGAQPWSGPPVWLHGDLHPGNVLVSDGHISAVLDFGDLTAGDPAVDLAAAWMLFGPDARSTFRKACGHPADEAMWTRARGWTLALNLAWLTQAADDPLTEQQALAAIDAALTMS